MNLTGTLGGSGDATMTGVLNWTGSGIMAAGGKTIITSAVTSVSLSDGSAKTLRRVLENHSTINWSSGYINLGGGTLNNGTLSDPTGTINATLTDDHGFQSLGGINAVNNAGIFNKAGAATLTVQTVAFNNTGTVHVQAGTMQLSGAFSNFAGTTLTGGTYIVSGTFQFNNANIVTSAANIILDGPASAIVNQSNANGIANLATITAAGALTIKNGRNLSTPAALANAGGVNVGTGSTLTVNGNYAQSAGSTALDGGTLDPTGTAAINAGELRGNGTLAADTTSAGTVRAGLSPGLLNMTHCTMFQNRR